MLTTAYDYECSSSTLGTLERCQRPVPVSSSELVLVLDGLGAGVESTVTQVVIQTHIGSGNACNVKIGTYPVHLGVDPAPRGAAPWEPKSNLKIFVKIYAGYRGIEVWLFRFLVHTISFGNSNPAINRSSM